MSDTLRFGRFEIRLGERALWIDGRPAPLGSRAFDLLAALASQRERVVTKAELMEQVWPGLVVEENNLQVQASTLRRLLGPGVIATVPGRGYRFVAAPVDDGAPPAAAARAAGRLPPPPAALIGRDDMLAALAALLPQQRLLTLVGPAGVGKTTLACAAAHATRPAWRDGACWVSLASVVQPSQLVAAVAEALQVTLRGETSAAELGCVLSGASMLVVLDNGEHLLDALAVLVEALLAAAPRVHLLVTSQELLNVPGERLLKLAPLAVPPSSAPAADALGHGAVRLFVERARAADAGFAPDDTTVDAIADICRRLDGLPLAIELAAARVRVLGVAGVRDRLGERFRVLTGGARTAMPRHRTLHAALDWSHALLEPDAQAVLRRLGVFVGGFTLALAQQVCADERLDGWAVLDALAGLVDKSLVAVDAGREPPRYRLLETTRAYALERLADAGETGALLRRHAQAVAAWFVEADDARFGDGGTLDLEGLVDRLAPELDNWRAALDWAAAEAPATAVVLAGAGAMLLRYLGLRQEALARLLPLRAHADRAPPAAAAAFWLRLAAVGDNRRLQRGPLLEASERALAGWRVLGVRRRLQFALFNQAWSLNMVGETAAAEALLPEMAALERPDDPVWVGFLRTNLAACIALHAGRYETARSLLADALPRVREAAGEPHLRISCEHNLAEALDCLGRHAEADAVARAAGGDAGLRRDFLLGPILHAQTALGRLDEAWRTLADALPAWRRDAVLMDVLHDVAVLFARSGRAADAARLGAAADAHQARLDAPLVAPAALSRARLAQALADAGVHGTDLQRWRGEGAAMDEAQAAALIAAACAAHPR